jgi:predicted DsbA family dithiol-disulfide isomerase
VKVDYGFETQEALAGILAQRHFEEKQCVSRKETLLQACQDLGLATEKADRVLNSDTYLAGVFSCSLHGAAILVFLTLFSAEVLADIERAQSQGFYSIPVFVFQSSEQQWVVHGAAEVDEFEEVLTEIAATFN